MKVQFHLLLLASVLSVKSQNNFDFGKFMKDASSWLQTAVKAIATFKPDDFAKLFQAFMNQDDQKAAIELLEGILQGGDTQEALLKYAGTKSGEILFEKLEPMLLESLEMKEKYLDSFNAFKKKAEFRKAKRKQRSLAKKKKRKQQEQRTKKTSQKPNDKT